MDYRGKASYPVNDLAVATENIPGAPTDEATISLQKSLYDPGYVNAMSHFYRGELGRIMIWRQRLDITTNWAITSSTAIITIAFSNREVPHIIFFFNLAIVWVMLWIEARRYRFYDAFRARVRMLEAHFLVPMVMENRDMLQGEWKKLVCEDLILPSFKISKFEAVGRRLKRNYVFIFALILIAWVTKIFLHGPSTDGQRARFLSRVTRRPNSVLVRGRGFRRHVHYRDRNHDLRWEEHRRRSDGISGASFSLAHMSSPFEKLCEVVAQLRAPGGCPWDREQTNDSLTPKLVEEVYETVAAVRNRDDANFAEELGDVLLLVLMHAEIAREEDRFDIDEVTKNVTAKLIRRHPHVFGTSEVRDSAGVVRQWDAIKLEEKKEGKRNYLDEVGAALPALMRAQKIQRKAAHVKFDWSNTPDVMAKVDEELAETKTAIDSEQEEKIAEEIGDLLFAIVNLARKQNLDAETLLQAANDKFVRRFHALEDALRSQGKKLGDVGLDALDEIWNAQKAAS